MKERVKNYIDSLFSGIYDTDEVIELKEEVVSNLLEKIEDIINEGYNENEAFKRAISELGNMNELIQGLKETSHQEVCQAIDKKQPVGTKHVIGYIIASTILLLGIMLSGMTYFDTNDLLRTTATIMPSFIISVGIFAYFGLTQETKHNYGMIKKRALVYSISTMVFLSGVFIAGLTFLKGTQLAKVLGVFMIFSIPSTIAFIYLGLTEQSRSKAINQEQMEHYSDPKTMMIFGKIIAALWIFTFGAIPLVGFRLGWRYAWIPFVLATGLHLIIEAVIASHHK
ncbi:MAG: permease prefix domain 1-containing protein [Caldicoprobacterales bacterium]|jgi:hypothetical protein|nr:hypothetical protein [Clostridiales bacterium]